LKIFIGSAPSGIGDIEPVSKCPIFKCPGKKESRNYEYWITLIINGIGIIFKTPMGEIGIS
jgi:hypothetical protein